MTTPSLTAVTGTDVLTPAAANLTAPKVRAWGAGVRWQLRRLPDAVAVLAGLLTLQLALGSLDLVLAAAVAVGWPLAVQVVGSHRLHGVPGAGRLRVGAVVKAGGVFGLSCWTVDTLLGLPVPSGALLALTVLLTVVSLAGHLATATARSRPTRVLVTGHEPEVTAVLAELDRIGTRQVDPVAVCSLGGPYRTAVESSSDSDLATVATAVAEHEADAVLVLPGAGLGDRDLQRLGWLLAPGGTDLYVGTGLLDVAPTRTSLTRLGGLRLLRVQSLPRHCAARLLKDLADRLVAAAVLLVGLPVLLGVAIAVRRDSPGPALFRQTRVGRDGRRFTMLKFRTMRTSAESEVISLASRNEGAGVLFKLRQDPRVTRVGALLRRYSLDELPQLINVVRGEMSLVGPRPALPEEVAKYDGDPLRRLAVKPGLTGLWQVSGRSDLSWEQSVRLDLAYVDNWSLGLDLQIVARTFRAVLGHRGAY